MSASVAGAPAAGGATVMLPAPAPPRPSTNARKLATLSASELRAGMQQHFRANGTLQQLKTQLRGMMLTDLLTQPTTARMLVGGAAQSIPPASAATSSSFLPSSASSNGAVSDGKLEDRAKVLQPVGSRAVTAVPRRSDHTLQTWSCGLADALVENHLRRTRRAMSLSIFSAEAEVPPFSSSGAPSEEEQYLAHLFRQTEGTTASPPSSPEAEDDFLTPSPSRSVKSVLQRLVEDWVTRHGLRGEPNEAAAATVRHLHSCSTQTDAADTDGADATNPLNSLECRLAAVDAKYALTFAQLRRTGATGEQPFFLRSEVERRLAQYKADMHAQLRSEYEQKYNTFTRVQLQEAKDEAEQRYRVLIRNKTDEFAEVERSVMVKLEQERERLKLSWEDVHKQRLEMERRQRDMAKQLADHEAAQQQKEEELHKVKDKCRALQLQCTKWEELCATRLMELDGARSREERRLEDLRRLQAEHASELRLKDEEVGRLRYRIRLLTREVEVPITTNNLPSSAGEDGVTASPSRENQGYTVTAAASNRNNGGGGVPVDPKQLYGLLLRTEELQRNAVLQQQQQQQRWDAAWVAAAATGAGLNGQQSSSLDRAMTLESAMPKDTASLQRQQTEAPVVESRAEDNSMSFVPPAAHTASPVVSSSDGPQDTPVPAPTSTATAPGANLVASSSSVNEVNSEKTTSVSINAPSAAKPASLPFSPPAAPITVASQPATLREASSSTARTSTTATSTLKSRHSAKASSASSASSSCASKSSKAKSTSTSSSVTPQKTPNRNDGTPKNATVDLVALQEAEIEEGVSRDEIVNEEDTARAGIVWSENNKREIVEETLRKAKKPSDEDSENDGMGGGMARPWERLGMGSAAQTAPALGGGTIFDDSFSTDDDALIRSSTEDDSDF